jgi:hypothetical protein
MLYQLLLLINQSIGDIIYKISQRAVSAYMVHYLDLLFRLVNFWVAKCPVISYNLVIRHSMHNHACFDIDL